MFPIGVSGVGVSRIRTFRAKLGRQNREQRHPLVLVFTWNPKRSLSKSIQTDTSLILSASKASLWAKVTATKRRLPTCNRQFVFISKLSVTRYLRLILRFWK